MLRQLIIPSPPTGMILGCVRKPETPEEPTQTQGEYFELYTDGNLSSGSNPGPCCYSVPPCIFVSGSEKGTNKTNLYGSIYFEFDQ